MTATSSSSAIRTVEAASPSLPTSRTALLKQVEQVCTGELRPKVRQIDGDGFYPTEVMKSFGRTGVFAQHLEGQGLSSACDMPLAIEAMALVGFECLSTAFCVWCHDACGWYLENTTNRALRDELTPALASGEALGGTGLSNPMKFYSGIESLKLVGQRVDGGFVVNGVLPWVSNLDESHYFGLVFKVDDDSDHRVMALVRCDHPGISLCDGGRFIALEGSGTYSIRVKNCFISEELILADPADEYIKQIRPGFVLMQVGMAIGHVQACADLMRRQDRINDHVNCFLPDSADDLDAAANELLQRTQSLAETPRETSCDFMIDVFQARLDAGELSLTAAQACMLNGGARAYMEKSHQFRKLRESYFVAVVTPATKHLRKEIARLRSLAS